MDIVPIKKNTVALTTLAMLAAIGIISRIYIRIPVIPGLLELTPGFLFSELGGIVGGIPGGILVGSIVGIGGAMAGGEPALLPMIGNICLGIGTGYAIHITADRNSFKYAIMVIIGGGIIGGFIPSMTIFAAVTQSLELTTLFALMDMIQAIIWGIVAVIVDRQIIQPILGSYIYRTNNDLEELTPEESKN